MEHFGTKRCFGDKAKERDRVARLRRGYFASITHMDHEVGRVMKELDRVNLTDSTIVALISDHGFLLGEYGTWSKEMLVPLATQVGES